MLRTEAANRVRDGRQAQDAAQMRREAEVSPRRPLNRHTAEVTVWAEEEPGEAVPTSHSSLWCSGNETEHDEAGPQGARGSGSPMGKAGPGGHGVRAASHMQGE